MHRLCLHWNTSQELLLKLQGSYSTRSYSTRSYSSTLRASTAWSAQRKHGPLMAQPWQPSAGARASREQPLRRLCACQADMELCACPSLCACEPARLHSASSAMRWGSPCGGHPKPDWFLERNSRSRGSGGKGWVIGGSGLQTWQAWQARLCKARDGAGLATGGAITARADTRTCTPRPKRGLTACTAAVVHSQRVLA